MPPDTARIKNPATRRRSTWRILVAAAILGLAAVAGVLVWQWQREAPARRQYQRGEALYRQGNVEGALEAWQTATELSPKWPEPYYRLSEALEAVGENDVAVQVLLRASDAIPSAPHLTCRLAEAYVQAESPVPAHALSEKAVTQEPRCPRAHIAFAMARRDEREVALQHLLLARRFAPKDPQVLLLLARMQAHAHKTQEARETLSALQALQPLTAETHYLWGVVLSDRPGDQNAVREATGHLKEALRLDPGRWDAYFQLGVISQQQRRWQEALGYLTEAKKRNPYSPAVLYRLGTVARQVGDPRAPAVWKELQTLTATTATWKRVQQQLAQHPDDLRLMMDAAELSVSAGAVRAANRLAQAILERDPGNPRAQQVLQKIQGAAEPARHE